MSHNYLFDKYWYRQREFHYIEDMFHKESKLFQFKSGEASKDNSESSIVKQGLSATKTKPTQASPIKAGSLLFTTPGFPSIPEENDQTKDSPPPSANGRNQLSNLS
jgi:hypothetical protein